MMNRTCILVLAVSLACGAAGGGVTDAGDAVTTPRGTRHLLRATDRLAVRESPGKTAADNTDLLKKGGGPLAASAAPAIDVNWHVRIVKVSASDLTGHRKALADARRLAGDAAADPVFTDPASGLMLIANGEIILSVKPGVSPADCLAGTGASKIRPARGTKNQFVVTIPGASAEALLALAGSLSADPRVLWAEPNFLGETRKHSNDPLYPQLWHLNNEGSGGKKSNADINAPEAWAVTPGDAGVIAAVLDDGTDIYHPDLSGSLYINPGEVPGNLADDDSNGYVDDVNGWDFLIGNGDPTPGYGDDHGTAVSGLIAATADNGVGTAGVAPGCRLLPLRAFDPWVSDETVAEAIRYAGSLADVINISYTWSESYTTDSAIDDITLGGRGGKGCAVFASAGNDGTSWIGYPASYTRVFGVGASTAWDTLTSYSQYGAGLDFVAPGGDYGAYIITTDRTGASGYASGSYTYDFSGTSASSPIAAGVAALVLSHFPDLTLGELTSLLRSTCTKIGGVTYDVNGWNRQYGYGRLNAAKALGAQSPPAKVTLESPANTEVLDTRLPLIEWSSSLRATWYQVWIKRDGTTHLKQWVQTNFWQVTNSLPYGTYTWWVNAWNPFGNAWSAGRSFTVPFQLPPAANLLVPVGDVTPTSPVVFTWDEATNAAWYQVWINREGTKLCAKWVRTTSFTTNRLPLGAYQWWVQTYGLDGYGPWSSSRTFVFGRCIPLTPTGVVTETASPEFTWESVPQATWYRVRIDRYGSSYTQAWVQGSTAWTPSEDFTWGDYQWNVRPWNNLGYGRRSDTLDFSIP